jgi:hypothetical protein
MIEVCQFRTRLGRSKFFAASARVSDLGVVYSTTGLALLPVRSRPAIGQYSVCRKQVYIFSDREDGRRSITIHFAVAAA